ncbi:MAG: ribonuclease Y [Bdellovibrionales bacterium]|nr:ribonuclease Y [Bdellovibrionales bacterium]
MDTSLLIISLSIFIIGLLTGALFFLIHSRLNLNRREQNLKKETNLILNRAKSQANKIERQAKQKAKEKEFEFKKNLDKQIKSEREKLKNKEQQLKKQEENLNITNQLKENDLKKLESEIKSEKEILEISQKQLDSLKERLEKEQRDSEKTLEQIANMTKEEAKEQLKKFYRKEVQDKMAKELLEIEEEMKANQEQKAKLLLAQAMTRYSSEMTSEQTVETLPIIDSFSKGKIIGREGMNIKALENNCGVDLLIEEEQEIITLSCFDPVRRAIARKSIEKIMQEDRVNPAFIEKIVEKIKKDFFSETAEDGKKTCFELGIYDIHPEITKVIGRLRYHFLEGQNLLKYSIEMAHLSSLLATELESDKQKVANRVGLLHSIGLGIPHFVEGNYSLVGSQFCQKYGESKEVCQAIACHEGKKEAKTLLDHIIQCAYNLSQSRLITKRTLSKNHIKRLKDLESLANSFDGVKRSYAIQTGKEIRVLVNSFKVTNDKQMALLSWDISKKIKREMNLNRSIKVSVIREYKIIEHAR